MLYNYLPNLYLLSNPYIFAYDGEGDGATVKDPPVKPDPAGELDPKALAAEREKLLKVTQGLEAEIKALKTRTSMTDAERQEQEKRIEELNSKLMTKEELSKREIEKRDRQYKTEREALVAERDTWKTRYVSDTIVRNLSDAAVKNNAYNPNQIVDILRSRTEVVENEGKFEVKVNIDSVNDKGEPVKLNLTPDQAIKHLSESDDYLNLFKSASTGGHGGRGSGNPGQLDAAKIARENPELYRKLRSEGKI